MQDTPIDNDVTVEELENRASLWWPDFLAEKQSSTSVLPKLLETQDKFLNILSLCGDSPEQVFDLVEAAELPANVFVKHLVVLADYGGEPISRLNNQIDDLFPKGEMRYTWKGEDYEYEFKEIPTKGLGNRKLDIDSSSLTEPVEMDDIKRDIIMVLLHGASSNGNEDASPLEKCTVGQLMGSEDELEEFVRQRYIEVSRITGGARANDLGHIAEDYVRDYLEENLPSDYNFQTSIPGVTQNDGRTPIRFDIVIEHQNTHIALEVSFQVTTNSTIERKSGQAEARQRRVHEQGDFIGYVVDGAGNFERRSALKTICNHSDITVAYTNSELEKLKKFVEERLV